MQDHFSKPIQNLRLAHKQFPYPPAWPLYDEDHAKPGMNPQPLSPLFKKLSGELRTQIYQSVLTDPHRFLHIIKNRLPQIEKRSNRRQVAHFWCEDTASPLPTWQHSCYGDFLDANLVSPVFNTRSFTETSDRLLSLSLTCRLLYYETLETLYRDNIFHFRGSPSLLAFRSSLSSVQWLTIRHIHLSTFYTPDALWDLQDKFWPPENLSNWGKMCNYLNDLPALDSLRLDMVFHAESNVPSPPNQINNLIIRVLWPLREVKARVFEIEINMTPTQKVWTTLGNVNYVVVVRERAHNFDLYGESPSLVL